MRWVITLSGKKWEVERLASESLPGLSADAAAPGQLFLELHDPEGDITDEDAALHAAKTAIDTSVRHINGFGRLRWGRVFEGVSVSAIKSFDQVGDATQRVFADPATEHMLPEDFADIVEASGHPKPPLPVGIDVINALDGAAVTALAEANPEVGRVLHLIALMLRRR